MPATDSPAWTKWENKIKKAHLDTFRTIKCHSSRCTFKDSIYYRYLLDIISCRYLLLDRISCRYLLVFMILKYEFLWVRTIAWKWVPASFYFQSLILLKMKREVSVSVSVCSHLIVIYAFRSSLDAFVASVCCLSYNERFGLVWFPVPQTQGQYECSYILKPNVIIDIKNMIIQQYRVDEEFRVKSIMIQVGT